MLNLEAEDRTTPVRQQQETEAAIKRGPPKLDNRKIALMSLDFFCGWVRIWSKQRESMDPTYPA